MAKIAVVTDSTSDLTAQELTDLGVTMVPLKVLFGDESYLDWVELMPEEFYKRLVASPILPKTSQPSPADFQDAYDKLADEGYEGIVSIHLSAALSGTHESAMLASKKSRIPVRVVDSKEVTRALGMVVTETARVAATGADLDAVEKVALDVAASMRVFFVVESLEYLVKGGRAGKAQGLAASLLNIKPVLMVNDDGIIEPFKKVKGKKKAIAEMAAHVAEEAKASGRLRLSLLHAANDEDAAEFRRELDAIGADVEYEREGAIGAVIGTYTGPGVVGAAYYRAQ
ncbi:MAG TPA: DegV family protein [Coriobacteriia bacterium]|nr:DegV family protein [Coriobacteriia bacterium]